MSEEKEKPKARLFTKAEFEELFAISKATDMTPGAVTMERLCVGAIVPSGVGVATDVWEDEATGDIWCHYSPRPGVISRPPSPTAPPRPSRPPFDPSRPGLYAVPY